MLQTPQDIEKKFAAFQKSVIEEVTEQVDIIEAELDVYKKIEMQKIEDMTLEDTFFALQSEVSDLSLSHSKELSNQAMAFKKQLFIKRQELFNKVFDVTKENLISFTQSNEYKNFLVKKIKEYKNNTKCDVCEILIKSTDERHSDFIKATYELPCKIILSEQIEIGGLIFKDTNKGFFVNTTIDNALENQKEWFYSNCDLSIGE